MEQQVDEHGRAIVATGCACRIVCAVTRNGKSPAADFLDDLKRNDVHNLGKFAARFLRLADNPRIQNEKQFKKICGRIWEFKVSHYRIVCFQDGPDWVLTHGFVKKQQKWPKTELPRAERIRDEDLLRKNRQ
jgi:phage-related protein